MSALTFTLKTAPRQRVNCSPLTPHGLAGMSGEEISAIELASGKHRLRADALFDITGDDANDIVIINNSSGKLDYIGHGMNGGSITVHGDAGSYLGFAMKKGSIRVHGDADAFAASGLAGGEILIDGNVGDFLAAAITGDRKGMRGGLVIVKGNAGDRVGDQMRRGILLIEGNAGDYCASRMLAGTIGVMGSVGNYIGYGMRRGTVMLFSQPALHSTLMDCGAHTLPYLSLMFKSLRALPTKFAEIDKNRVHRYAGDIANDGKGEILIFM